MQHNLKKRSPNCVVAKAMDVEAFWDVVLDAVDRCEAKLRPNLTPNKRKPPH